MVALTMNGIVTETAFSPSSTSGVIGTTTNNDAAAGSVGELISSVVPSGGAIIDGLWRNLCKTQTLI